MVLPLMAGYLDLPTSWFECSLSTLLELKRDAEAGDFNGLFGKRVPREPDMFTFTAPLMKTLIKVCSAE